MHLQNHLWSLNSGQTQHRLGQLPLVIGMPVMFAQNYDVGGSIVNGCTGVLEKVRFYKDGAGLCHVVSCVVRVSDVFRFVTKP